MDDCGRAGARVASNVDGGSARGLGLLDDASHARVGAVGELGSAGSRTAAHNPNGESHWFGTIAEHGIDLQLELMQLDSAPDATVTTKPVANRVRCPSVVAITSEPGAWTKLMGGFGSACAPILLVGTTGSSGTTVLIEGEVTSIHSVIDSCVAIGAHCLLAGCPSEGAAACEQAIADAVDDTNLVASIAAYEEALAIALFQRTNGPRVLAQHVVRDGTSHVAIARRMKKKP